MNEKSKSKSKPQKKNLTGSELLPKLLEVREQKLAALENAREELKQVDEFIEQRKIEIAQSAFRDISNDELIKFSKVAGKENILKLFMEGNYEELKKLHEQFSE